MPNAHSVLADYGITTTGNQTTAFATLHTNVGGFEVDLEGGAYTVNAIPAGRYKNGAFKVNGFCYAMPDFFDITGGALPRSNNINDAFQGGGFSWQDKVGLFFCRATDDSHNDVNLTYSMDGGQTWLPPRVEIASEALSHGTLHDYIEYYVTVNIIYENRYGILVKGRATKTDPKEEKDYRYLTKPIPRYEVKQVSLALAAGTTLKIYWPDHGLRVGDTIDIGKALSSTGADTNVISTLASTDIMLSGLSVISTGNDTDPFTNVATDYFRVHLTTSAAAAQAQDVYLGVSFKDRAWEELTYTSGGTSGVNIEKYIVDTLASMTDIAIIQGYAIDTSGNVVVPVSGPVARLTRIPNPYANAGGIVGRGSFNKGPRNMLTEPTIAYEPGTNNFFGFLRTQNSATDPAQFWFSTDAGATITQGAISKSIMDRSPLACALGDDGKIYGFGTERLTSHTGDMQFKPAYLLVADKAAAFAAGSNCGLAFDIYDVGELLITAAQGPSPSGIANGTSSEATNTGRPTAVKHGSWIYFFYEEEELADLKLTPNQTLYSNIKYIAVDTSPTRAARPAVKRGVFGH